MLKIIRLAIYLIVMTTCTMQASSCTHNDNIVSVSALEFEKEIKSDSFQLVDVRTPQEYTEGHIDGALNINVQSDDFKELAQRELSKTLPCLSTAVAVAAHWMQPRC